MPRAAAFGAKMHVLPRDQYAGTRGAGALVVPSGDWLCKGCRPLTSTKDRPLLPVTTSASTSSNRAFVPPMSPSSRVAVEGSVNCTGWSCRHWACWLASPHLRRPAKLEYHSKRYITKHISIVPVTLNTCVVPVWAIQQQLFLHGALPAKVPAEREI